MRILHGLTTDGTGAHGSHTWLARVGISRRFYGWRDLGKPRAPRAEGAVGPPSKIIKLMRARGRVLLLAALGASGQWRAAALVLPPAQNRMLLSWDSLGPGTQYDVQTSTNLVTWTTTTNTAATNVTLTVTGNKAIFRVSASNAPAQSVTLAWEPAVLSAGIAGYSIYCGVSPGRYTNRVNFGLVTNGVVSSLVAGTTYYFATTTYTVSGLESNFSNEAVWQSALRLRIRRLP